MTQHAVRGKALVHVPVRPANDRSRTVNPRATCFLASVAECQTRNQMDTQPVQVIGAADLYSLSIHLSTSYQQQPRTWPCTCRPCQKNDHPIGTQHGGELWYHPTEHAAMTLHRDQH